MLTEKNFDAALQVMNFSRHGNRYEKIFSDNVTMAVDFAAKKLFYPAQIKGRDRNNFFDAEHKENLVVFECVNRLLEKGYKPEDIWLEKNWSLGHSQKSGRADICVSSEGKVLFIIECKTAGAEFNHELSNMLADGGQLFSYWQQEQSCKWLMLYASDFADNILKFFAASVSCNEKIYRDAHTVPERFKIWSERYEKKFLGDVIFHDETVAYKIGVKPLRKRDLKNFSENKSVVNKFEEILRHNQVSDKENAFNRLIALFIAKLVDESHTPDEEEVSFQFRDGSDTHEIFQDRLQKLYADGMKKFMSEDIFYLPENYPDKVFENFMDEENHDSQIKDLRENFRKLKFYTNNAFAFIEVQNDKLFYLNSKILKEVVDTLRDYRIIGSEDLQTLGDLFEQLLDKGFKQDEGQFFTPTPIAQFIWDSLPLDKIISEEPPKIIDYACGAGHFLTEGFKAVNDYYARKNLTPPTMWERDKLFGVEKDYRLARVSKISLFMHGANEGKIKFGDGLENYPDENIAPESFDILVANPPYSVKGFKLHLKLANELTVLDKISNDGSEIETLFAERISQLVKPQGFAAVILPSSILNKENKSFVAARKKILDNFYIRAIVNLEGKTFGATNTNTIILFLERFDEPPRKLADYEDVAQTILEGRPLGRQFSRDIFDNYLKKMGVRPENFKPTEDDREKIIYFGLTYRQKTLIISAPKDNKEQEKFLGYGWSNAKGREGIVHKKRGGLLFDNQNRAADNTLAALVRAACRGEQIQIPALEKFYHYATLADLLDFDAANFNKKITLSSPDYKPAEYTGNFPLVNLADVCEINIPKNEVANVADDTPVSFVEMASVSNGGFIAEKVTRPLGEVRKGGYKYFAEGDIIIAKITPCMENGKCAIARGLTNSIGFGSTEFHVFRCRQEKILTDYLFVFLNREDIRQAAQSNMTGSSGHRRVPENFYSKLMLPLPPLDLQKKIVDEFNDVAAQIAQADDTIKSLDADIKTKFAALFEDKNFPIQKFSDVCKDDTAGGVKFQTSAYLKAGEVPIIDQGTNEIAGYMNIENNPSPYDDLPCVIFGDHTEIFKLERERFYLGADGTKIIIPIDRKKLDATFLFHMLKKEYKPLGGYARHFKNLKSLKLYLPPLELQEEFAAYVKNCEALKESARRRKEEFLARHAELVTKYFR
ncbi:MAG: N-6 DNA methylase [Selenomonadaceae bacterium]|nr:N-6 DNA methylase [Selenomonadaceae bacterium]